METNYTITFTNDNEVVFESEIIVDDTTFKDVPPTLLPLTKEEIVILYNAVHDKLIRSLQMQRTSSRYVTDPVLKSLNERLLYMRRDV